VKEHERQAMAIGANPAGARGDVTLTITSTNSAVITPSINATLGIENPDPPIGIGRREKRVPFARCRRALEDDIEHRRRRDAPDHLRNDVGDCLAGAEAARRHQSTRHRWIEMTAGNGAYRISHRQHREADGKCDGDQSRARRREQRGAANRAHQRERAYDFCAKLS